MDAYLCVGGRVIQVPKRIDGEFVEKLLEWASNNKVNDVVIESDSPLWVKRLGVMEQLSERNISQAEVREVLQSFYQQSGPDTLVTGEYIKFPFEVLAKDETSYRYRVTATGVQGERSDRGIEIIFRPFPDEAPPPAQLSLPADFVQAFNSSYGVIYVTGPTGSGKSTSFASVLTERIKNKSERIVTFEDPIEFDLKKIKDRKANVVQSEVPFHLSTYEKATHNLLRRSPDIVFFSEVRGTEVGRELLRIANSGHLVGTTLHANSCEMTLPRFVDMFKHDEKAKVTADIVETTVGILNQRLVKTSDGKNRVGVFSSLIFDESIRDKIYSEVSSDYSKLKSVMSKMISKKGLPFIEDLRDKFRTGLIEINSFEKLTRQFGDERDIQEIRNQAKSHFERGFISEDEMKMYRNK